MHPPRNIELSVHDELFVLSDINPKAEIGKGPPSDIGGQANSFGQSKIKSEELKTQDGSLNKLRKLEAQLRDLLYSTKELEHDVNISRNFTQKHFDLKLRSDLDTNDLMNY